MSMIPKTIHEVTPTWISNVLECKVQSIAVEQVGQGIGLMGDIFKVVLSGDAEAEALGSVVVKLPSSFEDNRQQGIALGMFDAEVRFYNELAPAVEVGLPTIYYTEIVPGTADFVIVMEDLSDLKLVSQSEGMTVDEAYSAVGVLAAIHATWWDQGKEEVFDWIPSMTGPRIEYVDQLLGQILPAFEAGFGKVLTNDQLSIFKGFSGNYLNLNKIISDRSPWTIAHQDYRVENMLFAQDGSKRVVVIDWQGIGRGPGVYDLAYLLSGSMDLELRRDEESGLVQHYYQTLVESGVTDYTNEQAWLDYQHAQLMGGLATAMVAGGNLDLSNERGHQLVASMAIRHSQAAIDHGGLELLRSL